MEVEIWAIEKLKNECAVDRMVAILKESDFTISVLARSDGEVMDGHLRLKVARKLALQEVPPTVCDAWSAAQAKAFRDVSLTGFKPHEIGRTCPGYV